MERWLADAGDLLVHLPEHRAALAALRARGRAVVVREPGINPMMTKLLVTERVREAALAELRAPEIPAERSAYLTFIRDQANRRIGVLERAAEARPSYRYDLPEDQWLDDNLAELVARLAALDVEGDDFTALEAEE